MIEKIGVSACLVGKNTKYDGTNNENKIVLEYLKDKDYVLICPEVLGGLPIPRYPSERKNDKVINTKQQDVTSFFQEGAIKTLQELIKQNVHTLIVKSNSPSCGYKAIYDGTFSKKIIEGNGVFVDLALKNHFTIYTEKDIEVLLTKEKRNFKN